VSARESEVYPENIVNRVVVRLLKNRALYRCRAFPEVPASDQTIVRTSHQVIRGTRVVHQAAQRRLGDKFVFRFVGFVDVPDVRRDGHFIGHLLELEHGVRTGELVGAVWMPADVRHRSFDLVGVSEH